MDTTDSILPYNHRPGTDLISKLVLTDTQVIIALSKALVPEAAEGNYVSAPMEFITNKKCDVLYAPHDPLSSFPLVLVEVQNQADNNFLACAIQYCTLTFERYNRLPIIVIFGIANVRCF